MNTNTNSKLNKSDIMNIIKEENMDKFEFGGIEYTQNDAGTHFFKVVGGKKTRIKYEEFERAFDGYWATQGVTDPVDEEQEQEIEKAKPKTKRKSKDVAFATIVMDGDEEIHITLTAKQVDFIRHLPDNSFWEMGIESSLWCDCIADDIGGQFFKKPMTVGAMISTLREKGLLSVWQDDSRQGKPKAMSFTEIGKKVVTEVLGL